MRTILILSGLPGAGKSAVSSYIREKGIPVFQTGDVIREEMKKRGLEFNNVNSEKVSVDIRKEHGMDYPARKTVEKIEKLDDALICADGPRDMFEVRCFADTSRVIIVIVQAPEKVRYERIMKAGGYKKPKSFEEFQWRNEQELKRGMRDVINTTKFEKHIIINDGTREELHIKIDKVLEKIKSNRTKE